MSGQVVNNQFGAGNRTVQAVAAVNEAGQIIGGSGAPMTVTGPLTNAELRATPLPVTATVSERDSTGQPFSPDACTHTYGYDASGLIVTDTATDGAATWVKTYTYNASAQLTGETQWVKQ